jgi:hypothetical protein
VFTYACRVDQGPAPTILAMASSSTVTVSYFCSSCVTIICMIFSGACYIHPFSS